ncbi:MAG TPA: hypothetical protein ENN44_00285 [Methanoculleus sp.]|nr:hypothetical protein [Methanoculleus sp.]
MKAKYICVLLLASLVVWPGCALGDGDVTVSVTGSPGHGDWLIAGDGAAVITVRVTTVGETVTGVRFDCLEPDTYGNVDIRSVDKVPYRTTFATKKSGSVPISIVVSYLNESGGPEEYGTIRYLDVDHNRPYRIRGIDVLPEAGVYEAVPITVMMEDAYGNVIDSRYEDDSGGTPESVRLFGTTTDGAGFYDGATYGHESVVCFAGPDGACEATYRTGTKAAEYLVHIMPEDKGAGDEWICIKGIAGKEPASVSIFVDPSTGTPPSPAPVPADGISKYTLAFSFFDRYGNPCAMTPVQVATSDGGAVHDLITTREGKVTLFYGPRNAAGMITITATSVLNASITTSVVLTFASSDPVAMVLTANPQSMPSNDVEGAPPAEVLAKVMDVAGNPVAGQTVLFSIYHPEEYPSSQVAEPYLAQASAVTNDNGIAVVTFVPGTFNTAPGMPGHVAAAPYDETALGTCTVTALWEGVSRDISLEWRNYPYLRVETSLSAQTVAVNDTVDVTIRLIGDGWALQPDPVDVVVAVDRSGSMLLDDKDRMVYAKEALDVFISRMAEGRDRIGMVTFGSSGYCDSRWGKPGIDYSWMDDASYSATHYPASPRTYAGYATLDLPLTGVQADVSAAVDGMVPWGGTPMRYALYTALQEIVSNGRDDAVRAVILLSDGDYNWYGDPLARGIGKTPAQKSPTDSNFFSDGTEKYTIFDDLGAVQNLSEYAADAGIRIYSIAFADSITAQGKETMRILAESTGGTYYDAPSGGQLAGIYAEIAGDLRTVAGVDTSMDMPLAAVTINNASVPNTAAAPSLEWVHQDGRSTTIGSVLNDRAPPLVLIPVYTVNEAEERADWEDDRGLSWDVGSVVLNQVWETQFSLQVFTPGNINLFGGSSLITFNGGDDTLVLPDTYLTAVENLNGTGLVSHQMAIRGVNCTNREKVEDYFEIVWDLEYDGIMPVMQELYYMRAGEGMWYLYDNAVLPGGPVHEEEFTSHLYVADFPKGDYHIRVYAHAPDADALNQTTAAISLGNVSGNYIKIT